MSAQKPQSEFPPDVVILAVSGLMQGMVHFDGHPYQQGIAHVYCHALRYCLLNEIEGTEASATEVLQDVVARLPPATPQPIVDGIRNMSPAEFDEAYKAFRLKVGETGVDLEQLANALAQAPALARGFMPK